MQIQDGEGWRLRFDARRQPFSVLIGGRDWAAELTVCEAAQLKSGVGVLVQQLASITPQLMPEETIELEHAAAGLWIQLCGLPGCWSLRFVLDQRTSDGLVCRGLEGGWDAAASAALAAALAALVLPVGMANPA